MTRASVTPAALAVLALLLIALPACAVRSISNTARPWGNANTTYAGEISDFDVVGCDAGQLGAADVQLRRGARLLVVQSGAVFPDEPMMALLGERFEVASASGMPSPATGSGGMWTAAARGGFDAVLAYWGVLESRSTATAGKAAAWVPIVGFFVPDENQQMRIRLRMVVVDTRTGRWRSLQAVPVDDQRDSSMVTRHDSDFEQVQALKDAAYRAAATQLGSLVQP